MRLFEMRELPASIGGMIIVWNDEGKIGRKGDSINLPFRANADFWTLRDGRQFLYQYFSGLCRYSDDEPCERFSSSVFFGGMDTLPFLVELNERVIETIAREDGSFDDRFLRALKPAEVLRHEAATGVPAPRQGDWFAVPFCPHKDDIAFRHVRNAHKLELIATPASGDSLCGTPHKMHDGWVTRARWSHDPPPLIGQGVLKKNGHPDLVLATPHLLLRPRWIERTFPAND